jgi:hypothetical protein
MKKILTFISLFLILIISVSCAAQKTSTNKTTANLSSQPDEHLKVKAESPTENIVTPPDNPTEEPSLASMIKDAEDYPAWYPRFSITSNNTNISWIRSDTNYTGKPGGRVGNTSFGADDFIADHALKATNLKPGAIVELHADEVSGLDQPKYKVFIYDNTKKSDKLVSYPLTKNQVAVPKKVGKYLFLCRVDWGKGDNEITYWFKINIAAN